MDCPTVIIDNDLLHAAEEAGRDGGRSAEEQLACWARVGREIEAAPSVSTEAVADVLGHRRTYDTLTSGEQAVVRAIWAERIQARAHRT